jgi:hypothetical protein
LLLTGVHNSIHNLGDTSDIETKSEAVAVDASSLEEQKQTVLEVSKYLTEVKPALQRTEDSTTVGVNEEMKSRWHFILQKTEFRQMLLFMY